MVFSQKIQTKIISYSPLIFKDISIPYISSQKHLGIILDLRLWFHEHLKTRLAITRLYTSNLDSGNITYDLSYPGNFVGPLNNFRSELTHKS